MRTAILGLALVLSACQARPGPGDAVSHPGDPALQLDLPVCPPPYHDLQVSWKHRLDQPYVFLEERGSYTRIGALLERASAEVLAQGLAPAGPPFALYYDDPAKVPLEELRMRACFPVGGRVHPVAPLSFDALESTTVVYAYVSGPYPDVPRAYPRMYAYLSDLGWVESGPIRETYFVNPALVKSFDELVTEIQIPSASAP